MPSRLFLPLPPAHVFTWLIGWSADQIKRQSLCRVQERHQDTHLSPRKGATGEYLPSMWSPICLSVVLFLSLLTCLSLCLLVFLFVSLSHCQFLYVPVCLSADLPHTLFLYLPVFVLTCLPLCWSACVSAYLSDSFFTCLSLCWLTWLSIICLFLYWPVCLSSDLFVFLLTCLTLCWPVVSLLSCLSLCCPLCLSVDLLSLWRPVCLSGTLQQSRCVCKSSAVGSRKEEVDAFPHFLYGGDGGAAGWDTRWHHQYSPFIGDPPLY